MKKAVLIALAILGAGIVTSQAGVSIDISIGDHHHESRDYRPAPVIVAPPRVVVAPAPVVVAPPHCAPAPVIMQPRVVYAPPRYDGHHHHEERYNRPRGYDDYRYGQYDRSRDYHDRRDGHHYDQGQVYAESNYRGYNAAPRYEQGRGWNR